MEFGEGGVFGSSDGGLSIGVDFLVIFFFGGFELVFVLFFVVVFWFDLMVWVGLGWGWLRRRRKRGF